MTNKEIVEDLLAAEAAAATRGEAYLDERVRDAISSLLPQADFGISFHGEAYEVFQKLIKEMPGYGVTVITQDGEVIEGYLKGGMYAVDPNEHWGDTVAVQPMDASFDNPVGPVRAVRVGRVEVH